MNMRQMLRAAALALVTALSACGGGGGNPGTCFGSPEVCLEGDNPNFGTPTPTGSVSPSVPTTNTTTTTTGTPLTPTTGTTSPTPGGITVGN